MRKINLKNKKIEIENILSYGFQRAKSGYLFEKDIFQNQFHLIVTATENEMTSKLMDNASEEEYALVDVESSVGEFVGKLKQEYDELLNDIIDKCTVPNVFHQKQTLEIIDYVKDKYGNPLEFLWDKYEGDAIYRNSKNQKWYAALLTTTKNKFEGNEKEPIEVIDLRCDTTRESMVNYQTIFPGYHMNKKSWITVPLDGRMKTKKICELIDQSYELVKTTNAWVLPSNVKMFDVEGYLDKHRSICWHQPKNVQVGDYAYIYYGVPYSAIMAKCVVEKINLQEYTDCDMQIRLIQKYEKEEYPLSLLKEYGLTSVRGPRSIPERLAKLLEKKLKIEEKSV